MFNLKSTIQKADGTPIMPVVAELLLNGGTMMQFRAVQPGYVGHGKEITEDGLQFIVTMQYDTEEQYNAAVAAEEADPVQAARLAEFNQFVTENGITITRETSIV